MHWFPEAVTLHSSKEVTAGKTVANGTGFLIEFYLFYCHFPGYVRFLKGPVWSVEKEI